MPLLHSGLRSKRSCPVPTKTKIDDPMTIYTNPAGHVLGARLHPATHEALHRDVRPEVLELGGNKVVVEVPGWYSDDSENAVFSEADDKAKVRGVAALNALARGFEPASK